MKVNLPEISAPNPARTPAKPAGDDKARAAFDDLMKDPGQPADPLAASRTGRKSSRAAQLQPHWQKFAAILPQPAETDELTSAGGETDGFDSALGDRGEFDHAAGRDKTGPQQDAPQFDGLPSLMALHELRHMVAADAQRAPAIDDTDPHLEPEPSGPARRGPAFLVNGRAEPAPNAQGVMGQASPTDLAPDGAIAQEDAGPPGTAGLKRGEGGPGTVEVRPQASRQGPVFEPVTVIREQSFAAPPSPPLSPTAAGLVGALAADGGLPQTLAAATTPVQPSLAVAQPTHMLKIELHPAELGTVTANLRLVGGQLSIELTPENQEAHRRLTTDADTIIKSLRGLGFDVDRVSVLQPQIAATASSKADATGTATASAGRDQSSFEPGNSGGNGDNTDGRQSGRNHNDDVTSTGRTAPHRHDRPGSALFI